LYGCSSKTEYEINDKLLLATNSYGPISGKIGYSPNMYASLNESVELK